MEAILNQISNHVNTEITEAINRHIHCDDQDDWDNILFDNDLQELKNESYDNGVKLSDCLYDFFGLFDNIKYKIMSIPTQTEKRIRISMNGGTIKGKMFLIYTNYNFYILLDNYLSHCGAYGSMITVYKIRLCYAYNSNRYKEFLITMSDMFGRVQYGPSDPNIEIANNCTIFNNGQAFYYKNNNQINKYPPEYTKIETNLKDFFMNDSIKCKLPIVYLFHFYNNFYNNITNNYSINSEENERKLMNNDISDMTKFFVQIDKFQLEHQKETINNLIDKNNQFVLNINTITEKYDTLQSFTKNNQEMMDIQIKTREEQIKDLSKSVLEKENTNKDLTEKITNKELETIELQNKINTLEEKINFVENEMLDLLKENKNIKLRLELNQDLLAKLNMQNKTE